LQDQKLKILNKPGNKTNLFKDIHVSAIVGEKSIDDDVISNRRVFFQ